MALIADLENILKTFYLPPIRSQLNTSTVLLDRIRAGSEQVSGQDVVTPLMVGYSQGVGARSEDGTLPTARKSLYDTSTTQLKANYGRIQLSGHLMRATRDDRGSFVRAVGSEIQNMVDGLKQDYNRQCCGDGTGALATVNDSTGLGTPTDIVVSNTQYFKYDMPIVHYNGASAIGTARVTDINDDTNTLTFASAATGTWVNGQPIYRGNATTEAGGTNNKDAEIMGLTGICDTGTLQGIDPTAAIGRSGVTGSVDSKASYWKTAKKDSSTTTLTLSAMQDCFTAVEKKAGSVNLLVTSYELRDIYATLLESQRRYVNVMELESGFKGLEYNGQPLIPDKDCPEKHMFFLDTGALSFQKKGDWDWMDMDGAIWSRVADKEAYEATIVLESQLVTTARNRSAVMTALTG